MGCVLEVVIKTLLKAGTVWRRAGEHVYSLKSTSCSNTKDLICYFGVCVKLLFKQTTVLKGIFWVELRCIKLIMASAFF